MPEGDPNTETFSKEYVTRLNNEAAATRKALEEVQAKLKSYDDEKAAASEEEAKKRGEHERIIAETKAELEKERRSAAQKLSAAKKSVLAEAIKAKLSDVADPDFVKLFDAEGVSIDDEFKINGLDEKISAFREAKPHLFKEIASDAGNAGEGTTHKRAGASPGNGGKGGGEVKFFDAMNSTPEQIKAYLDSMGVNA